MPSLTCTLRCLKFGADMSRTPVGERGLIRIATPRLNLSDPWARFHALEANAGTEPVFGPVHPPVGSRHGGRADGLRSARTCDRTQLLPDPLGRRPGFRPNEGDFGEDR